MICNECGSTRVGDAKFCGECGSKFELSNKEILDLEQQKILRMINCEKNALTNSILEKSYDTQKYIQYINSVRALLDFNEKNAELITEFILNHQDSDAFYTQLFEDLKRDNPYFERQLDVCTALSKNPEYDFNSYFVEEHEHLTEILEMWKENHKGSGDCSEEINRYTSEIKNNAILQKLHDNRKFIDFLKYRFKFTKGIYPGAADYSINKTQLDINTDNPNFKNDVIDLVDAALAFTSPISATRYVLKKMKS